MMGGEEDGYRHVFNPNKQLLMAGDEEICLFDSLTEHQLAIVGTLWMSETTIIVSQVSFPTVNWHNK